jgi:protein-disulfide isomerase
MTKTPTQKPELSQYLRRILKLANLKNLTLGVACLALALALAPYLFSGVSQHLVRQALTQHPELLEEAQTAFMALQDQRQQAAFKKNLAKNPQALISLEDPVLGNPKAPITVVEFQDYFCGYCKAMEPITQAILKDNPDVRFVIKVFPRLTTASRPIAALALASQTQGRFAQVHHVLYNTDLKDDTALYSALSQTGINLASIVETSNRVAIQTHIDKNLILGEKLGLEGTPAFIVNGTLINGARPDQLKAEIIKARQALHRKL